MLLASVLVFSIVVGTIRGGHMSAFSEYRWRWPLLPGLALVVQVLAFLPDASASEAARMYTAVLHVVSYLLSLGFIWINRRIPWVWVIGVGLAANFAVIVANGGFMPVSPDALVGTSSAPVALKAVYHNSRLMAEGTRLRFLGDVFRTPSWFVIKRAFSLGDVMIGVGAFGLVQQLMQPGKVLGSEGSG